MGKFDDIFEYIICLFFPNRCKFCGELTEVYENVCETCTENLPWIDGEVCPLCGSAKKDCNCKGKHGHYYEEIAAPLYYDGTVKECIHNFKFKGEKLNYKCLSELMTAACRTRYRDIHFDYITYIPMDKHSQRVRGYNQSYLLAKQISKNLNISFGDNMIIKLYNTDNQHNCNEIERLGNLLGVFDINPKYDVKEKTILIVDDVKTSGSTLSECGKMLYLYKAKSVFCLTAALVNSKIKEDKNEAKEDDVCSEQK